jgi:transglutaminase-like putative cysteine protease
MIRYKVVHRTIYDYTDQVSLCHNKAHLTPRDHANQHALRHRFAVTPEPAVYSQRTDFFGNRVSFFTVQTRHDQLVIDVQSEVDISPPPPSPPLIHQLPWDYARVQIRGDLRPQGLEAYEFTFDSPHIRKSDELADYAEPSFPRNRPLLQSVLELNSRIHADFKYVPESTTISTTLPEVMKLRRGVCQDFAHLMIGCLRSLGLSARYVSGYLRTLPPPGKPRLVGADASHAWVGVYFPGVGWVDFDPTNDKIPSTEHITLAWGRDYGDVSPIRGSLLGGGGQTVRVSVDVEEIGPRRRLGTDLILRIWLLHLWGV